MKAILYGGMGFFGATWVLIFIAGMAGMRIGEAYEWLLMASIGLVICAGFLTIIKTIESMNKNSKDLPR